MATAQSEPLNSNLGVLSRKLETTFAVVPGATSRAQGLPTSGQESGWTKFRFTGESLEGSATTQQSGEITGDFMIADIVRTNESANGTTNHEFTVDDYDDIILGNLGNAATSFTGSGAQSSHTIPASATIDDSSGVLEITSTGIESDFAVDDIIYLDANHSADATVHGFHRVTAESSNTLTLESVTPTGFSSQALIQSGVIYAGEVKANGTAFYSWTIVREVTDGTTTLFEGFRGMFPGSITWDNSPGSFVNFRIDWIGADSLVSTTDPISGTPAALGSDTSMTTPSNMNVRMAGIEPGASRLQLTLGTGAQPRDRLGFLGAKSIARRQTNPSVQIDFDLEDWPQSGNTLDEFIDKFENETAFNFFSWYKGTSKAYVIELPSAKIATSRSPIPGANTDVLQSTTMTGIKATLADASTAAVRVHKWTTLAA